VGQRRPTTLLEDAASQLALVTVKSEDGTIIESGVRPKKQAMERAEALQSGVEPRSKGEVLAMMGLDSLGLAASVAGGVLIGWTGVGLAPAVIGAGLSADSLQSHMRELIDGKPHDTIVAGVAKEIGGLFTEDERDLDRIGRGADTGANLLNLGMAMKSLIQAAPKLWQGARTTFELRGGFFPGMRGMTAGGALAMEAGAPLIRVSVNTGAIGEVMLAGNRCVTSMVTIEVRPLRMTAPSSGGVSGGGKPASPATPSGGPASPSGGPATPAPAMGRGVGAAPKAVPNLGKSYGRNGTVVSNPGREIKGVVKPHGDTRMMERGVSLADAEDLVKNPGVVLDQGGGKHLFMNSDLAMVLDSRGLIVTVVPRSHPKGSMDEAWISILKEAGLP